MSRVRAWRPDVIYLRFNVYAYPLQRLFDIAPVILEVVTNDIRQHAELGKGYALYNQFTRNIALRKCSGLVCISQELAHSNALSHSQKPVIVIGDGIDLKKYSIFPAPANEQPHLVFIGSPGNSWHGVEKLVTLAEHCEDLIIDVLGYSEIPEADDIPDNIKLHGYLSGQAYQNVLAQADAAISSLSLHSIGMEESSPLKTRECAAFGIPIILPYCDTDLDTIEHPCIFRIPNLPDNMQTHADLIGQFVRNMKGKRLDGEEIRNAINSQEKEQRRLLFFQQIVDGLKLS